MLSPRADTEIHASELAGVLGWSQAEVDALSTGRFAAEKGLLTLTRALALLIFVRLALGRLLSPEVAAEISMEAALGAVHDDGEGLIVAWDGDGSRQTLWVDGDTPPDDSIDSPMRCPRRRRRADRGVGRRW